MSEVKRCIDSIESRIAQNELKAPRVFTLMKHLVLKQERDHLKAIKQLQAEVDKWKGHNQENQSLCGLQETRIKQLESELVRLKKASRILSKMILNHLTTAEPLFCKELSMQSFALHVQLDLCK